MASSKQKPVAFSALRVTYAEQKNLDVAKASKRLRAKIRGAYGKNDMITSWLDGAAKENRDGNRYPDVPPTVAKEILAL